MMMNCARVTEHALVLSLFVCLYLIESRLDAANGPATTGKWEPVMTWPNVPIHTHVLPNGKILFWGRRLQPKDDPPPSADQGLDVQDCVPFLWDPSSPGTQPTPIDHPKKNATQPYNAFCSGHTFLPDGKLLVVGGHITDGQGAIQASIFNYVDNSWAPVDDMTTTTSGALIPGGRWYPTAVTLADGRALVCGGSIVNGTLNAVPLIWGNGRWTRTLQFGGLPLYPRMHLAPSGKVFMNAAVHHDDDNTDKFQKSYLLDLANGGSWIGVTPTDRVTIRDYFSSVMYAPGKVFMAGGANGPVSTCAVIDLNDNAPQWTPVKDMASARRQHNATLLADGTILITGGTRGTGFNNLDNNMPVHESELWDPEQIGRANEWTTMAAEDEDRCYHSTAVLLPDGRVLSGGGGEYRPNSVANPSKDTHPTARIFTPPYLNGGLPRPQIMNVPTQIQYGQPFNITTPNSADVDKVTLVRLSSVTHSFNMNQRFNRLVFNSGNGSLSVVPPIDGNVCPPGHYILFIIDKNRVPSVGQIVRIGQ